MTSCLVATDWMIHAVLLSLRRVRGLSESSIDDNVWR